MWHKRLKLKQPDAAEVKKRPLRFLNLNFSYHLDPDVTRDSLRLLILQTISSTAVSFHRHLQQKHQVCLRKKHISSDKSSGFLPHIYSGWYISSVSEATLTTFKIPYIYMSIRTLEGVIQFFTGRMTDRSSLVAVRFKCCRRLKYEQSEAVWLLETPAGKNTENTQNILIVSK